MRKRDRPRLPGMLAVLFLGVVMAACDTTTATTTTEETTTTAAPEETTTTGDGSNVTTTTTEAETTTTVAEVEDGVDAPTETREVLSAQADEVVTDFLDRVNRIGPNSGHVPLEETDPFGGAVRSALEATAVLHDWAEHCQAVDWCTESEYNPAEREGRVEALVEAGEGRIFAYSDETYYVEGVYAANTGDTLSSEYFTGFLFEVQDGQAVLIDAVAYYNSLGYGVGSWLSALESSDAVNLQVGDVDERLNFEVNGIVDKRSTTDEGWLLVFLEVTNTGDEPIWPYLEGVDVTGAQSAVYNTVKATSLVENTGTLAGWSWGYGRDIEPGETIDMAVSVRYLAAQVGGGQFEVPIYNARVQEGEGEDRRPTQKIAELQISVSPVKGCETLILPDDDVLEAGKCMRAPVIDHEWR